MAALERTKYDTLSMALHWVTAILMIFMIFFGEDLMGEEGEGGETGGVSADTFLPSLHVSIGTLILLLTALRVAWRLMNPPPALPASMAPWEMTVTKLVHAAFYLLMIGLPLTGWLGFPRFLTESPAMAGVSVLGVMSVPAAPDLGLPVGLLHNLGSKVALVLVILHVVAALKHQFVNRDGLLARMSPHG